MNAPLVSVIMVVRNMQRFLGEAIESILRQSFHDFEFIIVDFGSTDRSKSIAADYARGDSRILLRDIPPCSLVEARNAGCFMAKGRYLAIMDADDVSSQDRLSSQVTFLENHPEVGFLGGAVEWINADGQTLCVLNCPTGDREIRAELPVRNPFVHHAALIRREAFCGVGGYRRPFLQSHDYDLWLRLAEHHACANLSSVVLKYRIHPQQVSALTRRGQVLCKLAAQTSADLRRKGKADPADSVEEITSQTLCAWGVSQRRQQQEIASECLIWLQNMCRAGEYPAALKTSLEMLNSSDWEHLESGQFAELHLAVARLYRSQRKFWKSLASTLRAVGMQPAVAGRLLRSLLRRLRPA